MIMLGDDNIFAKYEKAKTRVKQLEDAIKHHKDAKGHQSCWLNDKELYAVLGYLMPDRELPTKEEFLAACEKYYSEQAK